MKTADAGLQTLVEPDESTEQTNESPNYLASEVEELESKQWIWELVISIVYAITVFVYIVSYHAALHSAVGLQAFRDEESLSIVRTLCNSAGMT
jgi:hypothetical protein